ncbi:MAG: 8-oxoguanine DNA glycosylase [Clostridia bacterium]|nr:8-oxoguanine DNA glycosylase [Clostridia bacterium]
MKPDLELKIECFNLKYTLECGQCFRWEQIDENEYIGIIQDRVIRIKQGNGKVYVWSSLKDNLEEVVKEYFDLNTDYKELEESISKLDVNVKESLKYSSGIHILNQPLFETIISYIISANNNIKRISRSVKDISKKYGKKVIFENKEYYLFPTLEEIKDITTDDLLACGTGFRARYIKNTIKYFEENIEFLKCLEKENTEEAKKMLTSLMGIGPKVADCILLFALKRSEVFPIDVWVKRIMEKLYFKKETNIKEISSFAKDKFGEYAGIVQQHLFHNVREGNI